MERIALIPDIHANDHDPRAIELACMVVEAAKPDRVIFLGDILDYGWASAYPKNQGLLRGIFSKEVAAWEGIAASLRSAAPTARFQAILGNHEFRHEKGFLWVHPQFADWRGLSWREILSLDRFKIEWYEKPAAIFLARRNFVVTHGVRLRTHSGGSGMAEMTEEWGCSGASGHTHRMGQVFRTLHRGVYCWTEAGHLQNRRPHYAPGTKVAPQNWQQGLAIMGASETEFRVPELVPFWIHGHKYRTRWQDQEFTA